MYGKIKDILTTELKNIEEIILPEIDGVVFVTEI